MRKPTLLWRSVLAEIIGHTALGLGLLGLLLLVQNLLRYLEELMAIGLDAGDVMRLLAALLPSYLPHAIPPALLFGTLLTFGRMSADGEVVALRASGIGIAQLLPPLLAAGAVGTLVMGTLLFELEPRGRVQLRSIIRNLDSSVRAALPGRFRALGERTIYVYEAGDESCPLSGVFLADFTRDEQPFYIAARCGVVRGETDGAYLTLELVDGSVHLPESGPDRYRILRFEKMQTHLDLRRYLSPGRRFSELTFVELLQVDRVFSRGPAPELRGIGGPLKVRIEIHRRLAFSLACLLLAVLALPLGVQPVRTGRSWGALVAITVMAGYWLLFTAGQLAAESRLVYPSVGLWAADAVVLVLAVVLVRRLRRVEV